MKIGIITQPLTTNYGGILQNFALQTVLRRMGHEVWTLDIYKYTWINWINGFCRLIVYKLLGRNVELPKTPKQQRMLEYPLRKFVHKHISLTRPRTTWFQKNIVDKYGLEGLVVGSDQVWRPMYNSDIADSFLKFVSRKSIKRIAYAASFGTDVWEFKKKQTIICSDLAKKFDAISVREITGIGLCEKYLGVNASHVLDPTLLLTDKDYKVLCADIKKQEPFVFAYILDEGEQKITEIKKFAEMKGLPYYIMSAGPNIGQDDSIEKWLSYFRDAAYIITDSFHGTAFSINFNKPFYVFLNKGRGNSRFESLLRSLELQNRIMLNTICDLPDINWTSVYQLLNKEKEYSLRWLLSAL